MMSALTELLANKIFLSGIIAWIGSQLIKVIVISIKRRKIDIAAIFELSGMPSTNVAILAALTTAIYLSEGTSTVFFLALAFFVYVLQEMVLSAHAIDKHTEIINSILKVVHQKYVPIRKRWAHTPAEVIIGILLGIAFALIVYLI